MFKFSIREVLLLTLVVALAFGWWVHHLAMRDQHIRLEVENEYLRDELTRVQFPKVENLGPPQVSAERGGRTHTLEWLPPTGN